MTPPSTPPNEASSLCDCTLNSWISSTIGGTAYVLPNDPSLFTPSSKNKLLRLDWPFTDGYENVPIGFDQMPPLVLLFCDTLTVLTPGVRLRIWVKFRPFRGRSLTCSFTTATPSSAVEVSSVTGLACTSTTELTDPALSAKSYVAVWFTTRRIPDLTVGPKPLFVTFKS